MTIGNATRLQTISDAWKARTGAPKWGLFTASGNASTKIFNIAHGLGATPTRKFVQPLSSAASGDYAVTVTGTNIVITFDTAPPTGTNNLRYAWGASATT